MLDVHPKQGLMTTADYQGGVRVVSLRGLLEVAAGRTVPGMRQLAHLYFRDPTDGITTPGASNTWSLKAPVTSWTRPFYAYSTDKNGGFDVYRVDLRETLNYSKRPGVWLTPEQMPAEEGFTAAQASSAQLLCEL